MIRPQSTASHSQGRAWAAFALLAVVAVPGLSMLGTWLRRRSRESAAVGATSRDAVPAGHHFPVAVVAVHGLLAAATLVLVLLARPA